MYSESAILRKCDTAKSKAYMVLD